MTIFDFSSIFRHRPPSCGVTNPKYPKWLVSHTEWLRWLVENAVGWALIARFGLPRHCSCCLGGRPRQPDDSGCLEFRADPKRPRHDNGANPPRRVCVRALRPATGSGRAGARCRRRRTAGLGCKPDQSERPLRVHSDRLRSCWCLVSGSRSVGGSGSQGTVLIAWGDDPPNPPRRVCVRALRPATGTGRAGARCRGRCGVGWCVIPPRGSPARFLPPGGRWLGATKEPETEATLRVAGRRACRPTAPLMLPRTVSPSCWAPGGGERPSPMAPRSHLDWRFRWLWRLPIQLVRNYP